MASLSTRPIVWALKSLGRIRYFSLPMIALTVVIGFLVLYPLLMIVWASFTGAPIGSVGDKFSLHGYTTVFTDPRALKAMGTTVWLSVVRMLIAVVIAVFLAWVVTRTNTPLRGLFENLMMVKFFLPSLPLILAWITLASPKTGLINRAYMNLFNVDGPLFNVYSYMGIILVTVTMWTTLLFLVIVPAFRGMDASLEESSRMSGASAVRTFFRITLPLMLPAILGIALIAFIRMMESFEVELFLGGPAGIYVFSTEIYQRIEQVAPPQYSAAMALSTFLIVITSVMVFLQWRLLGQRSYVTISGRGYRTKVTDLGRWKYVAMSLGLLYFIVAFFLPIIIIFVAPFMRFFGVWAAGFTLENFSVLGRPDVWDALKNTLFLAVGVGIIGVLTCTVIAYVVTRTKFALRKALDWFTWIPYSVPAIVLGMAFLWVYLGGIKLPFVLYGSIWLLLLVLIIRGFPLVTRSLNGTMVQLSKDLEESSRVHGASWWYTFTHIIMPLVRPSMVIGFIVYFILVFRDLATVIFLYSPSSKVLSVVLWNYWQTGAAEQATVIGLLIMVVGLIVAFGERLYSRRARKREEIAL